MKPIIALLALAATTITPSPSPTLSPTSQGLDADIQKIRQAVQEKVQEKLEEIKNPETNKKALIGTTVSVQEKVVTINYEGQDTTLTVDDDTVIINAKLQKTDLTQLKADQAILAMGYTNNLNVLETKRLVFIDLDELDNKNQTIVGTIVDISQSSPVFTLIPRDNKDLQYQIKTDSKTKYLDSELKTLKNTDIKVGDTVITLLIPDPKNASSFTCKQIIQVSTTEATE